MPEPDFEERVRVMTLHLERNIEFFGEGEGVCSFSKSDSLVCKEIRSLERV